MEGLFNTFKREPEKKVQKVHTGARANMNGAAFSREEWGKSFEGYVKDQKKQLVENLRINKNNRMNPNQSKGIHSGVVNMIEDEAFSYNIKSAKNVYALDLEKYYKAAPVKDRDGFVTIMCYDDCKFEGAYLFLGALKAMANIINNNSFEKVSSLPMYPEFNWDIENCMNIQGKRFINGCLHAKKRETMSTHHDYTFLFGCNDIGQRYIMFRIFTRVPNEKYYA